ncbi:MULTISPECIES: hypothetical protein [unclassified Thioalkalivibrio]|uniref:hypothetical protein n=1 Tax=unclassified Thioalkalivibrio TaxID=2621013 RepID=UPI001E4A4243|nr:MULTISPECIES: hypothetical protein [unclassified Thioalkalivibrio]
MSHLAYFIGGSFDLTKREIGNPSRSIEFAKLPNHPYYYPPEEAESKVCLQMEVYELVGTTRHRQGDREVHIYQYREEGSW